MIICAGGAERVYGGEAGLECVGFRSDVCLTSGSGLGLCASAVEAACGRWIFLPVIELR